MRTHKSQDRSPLKVVGALVGMAFFVMAGTANATSINWTATGVIDSLTDMGGGTDFEKLIGATITLSITVDSAVYSDWFGFAPFAPIAAGDITISGSGIAANNASHPLTFPFPGQAPPYGFKPWWESNVIDSSGFFPAIGGGSSSSLPSGNVLTLAHGITPTTSGDAAVIGGPISIDDFPTGLGNGFTVAIHDGNDAGLPVITQYKTVIPTFTASAVSVPAPEPATILLFGVGLVSLAGVGRKKRLKK